MGKYKILVKQGFYGFIEADDEEQLKKKLATGAYGVLPTRGKNMIMYTPDNISEISLVEETKA